jgi:thymidylate synthase ThyX
MDARLVYDGSGPPLVPPAMGTPTDDQLKGTDLDRLGELASRICYDSLGYDDAGKPRGRSSRKLHDHILEVKNHSVYEHANFTVVFPMTLNDRAVSFLLALANRKGVWIEPRDGTIEVTANLRAVLEWERHTQPFADNRATRFVGQTLRFHAHRLAPQVVRHAGGVFCGTRLKDEDLTDDQAWVTLYLYGSRGFCYLPDTEILTKEGWKPVSEVREGEIILTKDPVTGKARWSPNKKTHALDYAGRVYWMESSQWTSPAVTRDHLMWAARYDLRDRRGLSCEEMMDGHAEKIPMERIAGKRFVVDHRIDMGSVEDPGTITVDGFPYDARLLFAFLGWMATDGKTHGGRCRIYQRKASTKPAIRALLTALISNDWSETEPYFEAHRELAGWVVKMIGPTGECRDLRPLFDYSSRLINAFLDAAVMGDGNSNPNVNGTLCHDVIYVGWRHAALQYQVLFALVGRSCNVRVDDRVGVERVLKTGQVWTNQNVGHVVSTHLKGVSLVKKEHHRCKYYAGKVYCPQTEDGIVYVRREGMAFWCCNSHEQVRHRFAVSQRSTRYVDEDGSPYIQHPLVTAYLADEAVQEGTRLAVAEQIARSVEADRTTYRLLVARLEAYLLGRGTDRRTARKQARGAARGYLGNALATELLFSAPVSGWKWIFSQRANALADAEIRAVYEPALAALKASRYGDRFAAFTLVSSPDGLGKVLAA